MRNVQFLCLRVVDQQERENILARDKQWWFPILCTDEKYWLDLSLQPVFAHMKIEELVRQMRLLLSMLLDISNNRPRSRLIDRGQISTEFSSLQNLNLICEAFRIPMNHLNPFGEFDWIQVSRDLSMSKLFEELGIIGPRAVQEWWTTLSRHLPIDYPLNNLVSRSRASELNKH